MRLFILVTTLLLITSCSRKDLFTINRSGSHTFKSQKLFTGEYTYSDFNGKSESQIASVFFEDGSVMVRVLKIDESMSSFVSSNKEDIYSNNMVDWGRYKIISDTVKIEFVKNVRPGGGIKFTRLTWRGLLKDKEILILPGPKEKFDNTNLQYTFPKGGIDLTENSTATRLDMDSSKAWTNN